MGCAWIRNIGVACALSVVIGFSTAPALATPLPGSPLTAAPGVPGNGRAWELVTMPDSVAASLYPQVSVLPDGNTIVFSTVGVLPGYPTRPDNFPAALSTRGATGWQVSVPLFSGSEHPDHPRPLAFAADLQTAIWTGDGEGGKRSLFFRGPDGAFTRLSEDGVTTDGGFLGADPNLQRVIFTSRDHLLPTDAGRVEGASVYERAGRTLRQLDLASDGSLLSECGSLGKAVSADATRVYFTADPSCTGHDSHVFVAEVGAPTHEASVSRCTSDCGAPANVAFAAATPSGSSAFLLTKQRLTDGDTNDTTDLYRYDAASDDLTLLTAASGGSGPVPYEEGRNPTDPPVAWPSVDGKRVYFLAAKPGESEKLGQPGLYLSDGSGVHLVDSSREAMVVGLSPSGRELVLETPSALTADDLDDQSDIYRYDAVTGSFTRISTGPSGGNGSIPASVGSAVPRVAALPNVPFRATSADTSRIFFFTAERLLAADRNDVSDVYEWTAGNLSLVSAGTGPRPSFLMGASEDGSTVLFETADALLASDRDGEDLDYYVARIGGGFPEPPPAAEPCPCTASPPSRSQLDRSTPASAGATDARIRMARLSAAARRRIVATGRITLLVEVPRGGRLSAKASARVGRRSRPIAAASARLKEAGPVSLSMRLARPARARLARGHDLQVHLALRLSGLAATERTQFKLEGTK
ncbi:MAG TPA: hypothetical protein VFJ61_09875 [Solirubrobacterales bacterium]|nr:hypothetical protein [Solirubrobacterales bacterium]